MPQTFSVATVQGILATGDFNQLIGAIENDQVEFKGSPYILSNDSEKCELAKDVSALANSNGGIILIGFRTVKDATTSTEYVENCRPIDRKLVDTDQYAKTLREWICPPLHSVEIRCCALASDADKCVVSIVVPESAKSGKPYIVRRSMDGGGRVKGNLIGYYERVQAQIPATSPETLRGYLKDGLRFGEISHRLASIEAFLGVSQPTSLFNSTGPNEDIQPREKSLEPILATQSVAPKFGPTDADVQQRVEEAVKVAERSGNANVIMTAVSTSECSFPDLFRSQSAPLVTLLEKVPILRNDGFAITPKGHNRSEIIRGRLRRILLRGLKTLDLWQDGALVAVGEGDDNLLCWFMRNYKSPKPGLPIRNFVLAEVVLNFCNLTVEVFRNAKPAPENIKFSLHLENMTEQGVPCSISSAPDNRPMYLWGGRRSASSPSISTSFTSAFENIDPGYAAYELFAGLYVQFGFNHDEVPYVETGPEGNHITRESLLRGPSQ